MSLIDKKSVYIHIPFCRTICSYCDFCKFFYNKKWVNDYLDALEREIKSNYKNEIINTIYIGGGTPSCLSADELIHLFKIIDIFNLDDTYEYTFECNLNDMTRELLTFLYANKVNRLSIGIESFNSVNEKFLNRNSNYEDAKTKINLCKKIGFNNINVDLIYALPTENIKVLQEDLEKIISLDVMHISTYSLMIENNTVLHNKKIEPINEELDAKMYELICTSLKENGYEHYEVSNFAKPDYYSKHNLVYWNNEQYYGFGCGASGYLSNIRYDNTRNILDYINNKYMLSKELLNTKDVMDYEIILGLRKTKGINIQEFFNKYHVGILDSYQIEPLIKNKELILKDGYLYINPKRIYVMNEILIKIV